MADGGRVLPLAFFPRRKREEEKCRTLARPEAMSRFPPRCREKKNSGKDIRDIRTDFPRKRLFRLPLFHALRDMAGKTAPFWPRKNTCTLLPRILPPRDAKNDFIFEKER